MLLSPTNPYLLSDHLICAAAELPLKLVLPAAIRPNDDYVDQAEADAALFGGAVVLEEAVLAGPESRQAAGGSGLLGAASEHRLAPFVSAGCAGGVRLWKANTAVWGSKGLRGPHSLVSIRAAAGSFSVVCTRTGQQLETVEADKAFFSLYVGSLYQHQAMVYRVVDLAISDRVRIDQSLQSVASRSF